MEKNWLAGKWYPVETIKAGSDQMEKHAFTLKPTADGGIVIKVEIPLDGACTVIKVIATKKSPGVFASSDGETTIMDTDYKTYLFTHISTAGLHILELYGRKKEVPKAIKKKFNTFVKKMGMKASRWKVWKKAFCKSPSG
nr:beta-lactoglobulin-like [Anolis sagrei ordinatus]